MDKIRIKEEIHYNKMGSKHPMSLRLKKTLANHWGSSPFHFPGPGPAAICAGPGVLKKNFIIIRL
jgi:hypothetical protein